MGSDEDMASVAESGSTALPKSESACQSEKVVAQCAVSADLVRRALLVRSTEETRYYLRGVQVSPHPDGGAYIVGTNGTALVCLHDPKGVVTAPMIVNPDDALSEALNSQRSDRAPRVLFAREDRLVVAAVAPDAADTVLEIPNKIALAVQCREATFDASFPDWRRIMRAPQPGANVPLLDSRELKKVGKALSSGRIARTRLVATGPGPGDPMWVFGGLPAGIGLIAPIVGDTVEPTLPAWLGFSAPVPPETPAPPPQGVNATGAEAFPDNHLNEGA